MTTPGADPTAVPEILIVDPDPVGRAALRALIAPMANSEEVSSGEAALLAVTTRAFAAILINVELPDAHAFDIVLQVRRSATARNVPVLFLTPAPPDWLTERKGYELGALGYLAKPIDPNALRAKLEILITLFRHGAELRAREQKIEEQQAAIIDARAALEEATSAIRSKDLYMGVLGHDLRNPLGAILMSARMMLMRSSLSEGDRTSLSRIARNGERMAALIRDILDYTRGQAAGGIPVVLRAAHMGDICSSMIDEMSLLHSDRTIHLEARGELRGRWDRERVEQVLSNLLANALTHGSGSIAVTVEGRPAEVVVAVHNGGVAIPAELLPTLFEPFHRGASSRIGLGLGLYIVSEILRAHNGTVEVVSTMHQGTKFTTRWPRATPSTQPRTST